MTCDASEPFHPEAWPHGESIVSPMISGRHAVQRDTSPEVQSLIGRSRQSWMSCARGFRPCSYWEWGCLLGWMLAASRPAALRASAGDRSGESIVATGPVLVRYDESDQGADPARCRVFPRLQGGPAARDGARLTSRRAGRLDLLDAFAERDLVADFKLDLDAGPRPRFLMTTGSLGPLQRGLGAAVCLRDDHQPGRDLPDADRQSYAGRRPAPVRAGRAAQLRQGGRADRTLNGVNGPCQAVFDPRGRARRGESGSGPAHLGGLRVRHAAPACAAWAAPPPPAVAAVRRRGPISVP